MCAQENSQGLPIALRLKAKFLGLWLGPVSPSSFISLLSDFLNCPLFLPPHGHFLVNSHAFLAFLLHPSITDSRNLFCTTHIAVLFYAGLGHFD